MLNSILSRPGEAAAIPKNCRFDETGNKGRIHGFNYNQGVYAISRRITKHIAPTGTVVEYPEGSVHHNDPAQKGDMTLGECHILAKHLTYTFGVTNLLPKACTTMLEEATGKSLPTVSR